MFKVKKLCAALVTISTMSLCGCKANLPFTRKTPNFNSTYTVNADITFDKLKAKAELTRYGESDWEFKFTEPKSLNGLSIQLKPEGYSATLGGLLFSAEENSVYTDAPQIVADAVKLLSGVSDDKLSVSDGVITFSEDVDGKRVTLTADESTGSLISLKCPGAKLSVNFTEQKPFTPNLSESGGVIDENAE